MADSKQALMQSDISVPVQRPAVDRDRDEALETPHGCFDYLCRYICIGFSALLAVIPIFWPYCIQVFNEYQRCVHFRLGKLVKPLKGPGMYFFLPFVDRFVMVDLRTTPIDVPSQEMMTKDSVTVSVNAVVFMHVRDAVKSVIAVTHHLHSTALISQTILRSVIGESELDELLQKRDRINHNLLEKIDKETEGWGVKVTSVEVKDVILPQTMQRAMASQAEAERNRRAKVISADGEYQSSRTLLQAANEMSKNPYTLQLRYLQTLTSISEEKNSTIIFPFPIEMLSMFLPRGAGSGGGAVSAASQ